MADTETRIFYRVVGRREDGRAVVRDALSWADAQRKASGLRKARRGEDGRWLPALTGIMIIPSEPVVFKYEEGEPYVEKAAS